jgi:S-adenosylmethionine-diacylgycerolhomoserine-N-methlytransferase
MKTLAADFATLRCMLRGLPRSGPPARRLEAFYRPQAERYDAFRERLLRGRAELMALLDPAPGSRIVELGAGTGRNLEFLGERVARLASADLVDLCPALLERARDRCRRWPNVRVIEGDATRWRPDAPVDCVYFSYALTMIPDWRGAIDNALEMLKPGGILGAVDFTAPRGGSWPRAVARRLWRRWFAHDGVYLDPAILDCLSERARCVHLLQETAAVPYLAGLRVPYFVYVGRKAGPPAATAPC